MKRRTRWDGWTPAEDARLIELRAQDLGWEEIGQMMNAPSKDAARLRYGKLKRMGLVSDTRIRTPLTSEPISFPDWKIPERPNWREWLSAWDDTLQLYKRANNIVQKLTVDLSTAKKPIMFVFASDLHLGGGFTNHKEIQNTLEYILDQDRMYVACIGDSIEGFIPGVKGAESTEQMAGSVGSQLYAMESLVDEFTDAGKLALWTWGDHDAKWFEQKVGVNIVKMLVDRKVPYFPGRGLVRLKVGDQEYFMHVNHGELYRSILNETHSQRRMYDLVFPADVTVSGHLHKPAYHVAYRYEYLRDMGLPLGGKVIYIQTGTFKTGPDPYSIRFWRRGIIGVPTVVFRPDRHEMDVFDSPLKAAQYVKGES